MHAKLLHQSDGQRTFAVILQTGDEAVAQIKAFADREKLSAAQLTAIGALSRAVLGYFDWDTKDYRRIPVDEQAEVASFIGRYRSGQGWQAVAARARRAWPPRWQRLCRPSVRGSCAADARDRADRKPRASAQAPRP